MNHIGISVPDINAALAWYRDVLGCYMLTEPAAGAH
ncbi:VOC family protein [Rhodococcus sp. WB1]